MKGTYVQKGENIDYKNTGSTDIGYNDVVSIVSRIAISAEAIPVGATGALKTIGVFELPAVNNAAFAVGDSLYWDATAGKLTKTSSGNVPAGWCTEAKADAGTTALVKIG